MSSESQQKESQLLPVLREGIGVVQMILFKEVRDSITSRYPDKDKAYISMLSGAIVNEVFGTPNPEPRFTAFFEENKGVIEQELLGLKENCQGILPALTDTLRLQALCDSQEGGDSSHVLSKADKLGILILDRPVPMPSSFMTLVRGLGEQHQLIIAPVQITPEEDQQLIH